MAIPFLILLILSLLSVIGKWYYAFRLFGLKTFANSLSIIRLKLGQPFRYGTFPVLIMLGVITICLVSFQPRMKLSGAIAITMYILMFLNLAAPPITLFLGTSSQEGKQLYSLIDSKTSGCISLLRATLGTATAGDGVRTKEKEWQKTVQELTRLVPIVVVDARVMSEAVIYEAELMLRPDRLAKVLFITGDDGSQPIIDALSSLGSIQNEIGIHKIKESEVVTLLDNLISNYARRNNSLNRRAR